MSRIVYVNGQYVPRASAGIAAEDRGFLFGDAVYEVCEVIDGRIIDEPRHIERLARSLGEIRMSMPMSPAALARVLRETVRRNRVRDGMVFLQVSRGVCPNGRDFLFPQPALPATIVCTARNTDRAAIERRAQRGIAVKTLPDNRWGRCDIKTAMLLAACLAKEDARAEGAEEAWFVDDEGFVTEGASSNAWIIDADGRLRTRRLGSDILRGVTRTTLLDVLAKNGISLDQTPFTVDEAYQAREAFVSSATAIVMPVVRIDGRAVGEGVPGPVSLQLRREYHASAHPGSTHPVSGEA